MDGVGASASRSRQNHVDIQVGLTRRGNPDRHRLIGETNVQSVAVEVRMDRDGLNAHRAAGAQNAQSDLAAIGNQDFAKGLHRFRFKSTLVPHRLERAVISN